MEEEFDSFQTHKNLPAGDRRIYDYIHVIMTGYIVQLPWKLTVATQLTSIMGTDQKAVFFDVDGDRYNLCGLGIQAVIEVHDREAADPNSN